MHPPSVVVQVVSLFLLQEFCEVRVLRIDSLLRVLLLTQLGEGKVTTIEHLACLSTLRLFYIVCV